MTHFPHDAAVVDYHEYLAFAKDYLLAFDTAPVVTDEEDAYWTNMEALERGADEFEYYHGRVH
jgi:hypothetical protein